MLVKTHNKIKHNKPDAYFKDTVQVIETILTSLWEPWESTQFILLPIDIFRQEVFPNSQLSSPIVWLDWQSINA